MMALVISVGPQDYLVGVDPILRIIKFGDVLRFKAPYKFVKGIVKFKNRPVPVIDLSECFGAELPSEPGINTCLILFRTERGFIALCADWAKDIVNLASSDMRSGPAQEEKPSKLPCREVKVDEKEYLLLYPETLLDEADWKELEGITAGLELGRG